ncbi:hypothetical protein SLA2020_248580 [Shorea laevis]
MSGCLSCIATLQALCNGWFAIPKCAPSCEGMSKLNAEASTTEERRELFHCLKDAAHGIGVTQKELRSCLRSVVLTFRCPLTPTSTAICKPFLLLTLFLNLV